MKLRKVRVTGEKATCLPDNATNFTHEVNLTNAKYLLAVNSSYFKVVDGEPVEKTQEDLDAEKLVADKIDWENSRDEILNSALVTYKGNYIDMSIASQGQLTKVRESLGRRSKKANWKVKSIETGLNLRLKLSKADINKISDAVIDASQIVHVAADTGFPVNPWPLEVV